MKKKISSTIYNSVLQKYLIAINAIGTRKYIIPSYFLISNVLVGQKPETETYIELSNKEYGTIRSEQSILNISTRIGTVPCTYKCNWWYIYNLGNWTFDHPDAGIQSFDACFLFWLRRQLNDFMANLMRIVRILFPFYYKQRNQDHDASY